MWDWDGSLDQLTHSATFPAWVAVACAALFGMIFLLSLVRAERTVANGALAALTFTGLALAAIIGLRSGPEVAPDRATLAAPLAGLPALACIDDLAGETALAACEKVLFSAPDTVAAAVAYTASRISRLTALGDASTANRSMTPDLQILRNAIERDRYGLVAYVLATRDKCQPGQCAVYASLTDHNQVAANMDGLIYEGLVAKYAPGWAANATSVTPLAVGKPSSIDFPTAASIPPVSIMTAEPPATRPAAAPPPEASAPAATPPGGAGGPYVPARTATAPKKRAPPKRAPAPAPGAVDPIRIAPSVVSEQ